LTFNFKEWHHGYLGIILLIIAFAVKLKAWLKYLLIFLAIVLLIDEVIQIVTDNQYGGILHNIYIATLYKIPFIKQFNIWLDGLFGK